MYARTRAVRRWFSSVAVLAALASPSTAVAVPYTPGSGWQQFSASSLGGGDHFNVEGPFTFDVVEGMNAVLVIGIPAYPTAWEGFDFGLWNGTACPDVRGGELHPSVCRIDLDNGPHEITFRLSRWSSTQTVHFGQFRVEIDAIPEPSTALLLGLGLVGLSMRSRS